MNRNESNQVEKMLTQVQLRQPELDIETLLRQAAEPKGSVIRQKQVARVRRKRCFCRWALLAGVWTSGLAVGILMTCFYVNSSLQAAQAELNALTLKLADTHTATQSLPQEKPDSSPRPVPTEIASFHESASLPEPQENDFLFRYDFLTHLDHPGSIDSASFLCVSRHRFLSKPCSHSRPHRTLNDVPRNESSPTIETEPYKPEPAKTPHQLFQEVLKDLNA